MTTWLSSPVSVEDALVLPLLPVVMTEQIFVWNRQPRIALGSYEEERCCVCWRPAGGTRGHSTYVTSAPAATPMRSKRREEIHGRC